jgi:hypothetical protein
MLNAVAPGGFRASAKGGCASGAETLNEEKRGVMIAECGFRAPEAHPPLAENAE